MFANSFAQRPFTWQSLGYRDCLWLPFKITQTFGMRVCFQNYDLHFILVGFSPWNGSASLRASHVLVRSPVIYHISWADLIFVTAQESLFLKKTGKSPMHKAKRYALAFNRFQELSWNLLYSQRLKDLKVYVWKNIAEMLPSVHFVSWLRQTIHFGTK